MVKLKLQYFGHLMWRVDSLEKTDAGRDGGWEKKGMTEDELAGWHHWLDGHESVWTLGVVMARPPCPSPTPRVHSNSRPLSQWCHPAISSSVILFSSCLQPFPTSGSFPMSQFFTSGGQSIGISASASVLPMNIQDRSPLGWTGWISLQSKGLSRVFSNTTLQKHQFLGAQPSSQSNFHIHTWPQEKP